MFQLNVKVRETGELEDIPVYSFQCRFVYIATYKAMFTAHSL